FFSFTILFTESDFFTSPMTYSQDEAYRMEQHRFAKVDIVSSGCTSCHMEYTVDGKSLIKFLNNNFNPQLLEHKSTDPKHINSLEDFVATHDEDEAALQYVELQKKIDYIAEF
ncbi:MAG: hypothetical protein AAGA77_22510, partial [Bacteroidota bacterium]